MYTAFLRIPSGLLSLKIKAKSKLPYFTYLLAIFTARMKNYLFLVFLFVVSSAIAQEAITLTYSYKSSGDPVTLTSKLMITREGSLHWFDDKRAAGTVEDENGIYAVFNDELSKFFVRSGNIQTTRTLAYHKEFVYQTPKTEFSIKPESKKIGSYTCQKALVNRGGRRFTVWFTTTVPIKDGPLGFFGLPGMIVAIEEIEGDGIRVALVKQEKGVDTTLMAKYKKYLADAPAKTYAQYEEYASDVIVQRKRKSLALVAERNIEFKVDDAFYYSALLDIPKGLRDKLGKIR